MIRQFGFRHEKENSTRLSIECRFDCQCWYRFIDRRDVM